MHIGTFGSVALTALGAMLGIALWYLLIRRERRSPYTERELFRVLLITGLVLRLIYVFFNPTFNAPDEQPHFQHVRFLHDERALPTPAARGDTPISQSEFHQPPLYYALLTPVYTLLDAFGSREHAQVIGGRLFSVLCWLVVAFSTRRLLDRLMIRDAFTRTVTFAIVCLLPAYVALSSNINNDNLLIVWTVLALEQLCRPPTLNSALMLGLLSGAGMLTKVNGFVIPVTVGLVLLARTWMRETSFAQALQQIGVVAALTLAIWSPVLWWNLTTHEHWLALGALREHHQQTPWASIFQAVQSSQEYIKESFWTAAGIRNKARFFPAIGVQITYIAMAGVVVGLWRRGREWKDVIPASAHSVVLGFGAAEVFNLGLLLWFAIQSTHGQGRYLFPLLPVIGLLTALGFVQWGIRKWPHASAHAAGFLTAYSVGACIYSFAYFARHVDPPWYL